MFHFLDKGYFIVVKMQQAVKNTVCYHLEQVAPSTADGAPSGMKRMNEPIMKITSLNHRRTKVFLIWKSQSKPTTNLLRHTRDQHFQLIYLHLSKHKSNCTSISDKSSLRSCGAVTRFENSCRLTNCYPTYKWACILSVPVGLSRPTNILSKKTEVSIYIQVQTGNTLHTGASING